MHPKKLNRKKLTVGQRICYHFVSCANICSIHGFAHIVRKNINPFERLLWFLLVTSATAWCIELGLQAWNHYQTRPTVISLERDHWKWNSTFPAVTICFKEVDNDRADSLISNSSILKETERDEFKNFLTALTTANFDLMEFDKYTNNSIYQNVDKYLEWVVEASSSLLGYPVDIEQNFGELQKFETILTEFGLCFAYNSRIAIYSTPDFTLIGLALLNGPTHNFVSGRNIWNFIKNFKYPIIKLDINNHDKIQGILFKCRYLAKRANKLVNGNNTIIMINPSIPAPTFFLRSLNSAFQIFFHGPNEIPDMSTKGIYVPAATFAEFELSIESVQTAPEVRDLKISQRYCRFSEETNLEHSPAYSYNLCRSECRRHLSMRLCNCVPYYYTPDEDENICNTAGMECLYKNNYLIKHLVLRGRPIECSCIQNCDYDNIIISTSEIKEWFRGTNVQWMVKEYPTVRYKRSLIFSNIDLLVQIGGVAGLFLGCSILSLIELLFYFTLRFYWGVIRGRRI